MQCNDIIIPPGGMKLINWRYELFSFHRFEENTHMLNGRHENVSENGLLIQVFRRLHFLGIDSSPLRELLALWSPEHSVQTVS